MADNSMQAIIDDAKAFMEAAPDIIGTEATRVVDEHFRRGELIGERKWPKRIPGTPRNSRKLLVDRGTLRDSVTYQVRGNSVLVGVDLARVPYAQIHNEGGTIEVTLKMKKYFWAQYLKTGNEFYKRLALKKGPIKIPARPYLFITNYMIEQIDQALTAYKPV